MARQQLSEKEKEGLKKQLEMLRQMLRQRDKSGDSQKARKREFARRAQGQGTGPGGERTQGIRLGSSIAGVTMSGSQGEANPGSQPGSGQQGKASDRAGSGTDSNLKSKPTSLPGQTQDVSAAGIDTGQGPSSSQVVYGAAERGFTGTGYKRVYTEYKTVAEEALERDRVPAGYETHVRRYFQLIRPRD